MPRNADYHTIIIGAGAAGLMCAAHAAGSGQRILLIDHAKSVGEKIRISGGGRCNFTNIHASPQNFISENPHFVKSALKRYSQWDFIDLVQKHGIAYHEKTLGQLFCDNSAKDIIDMLLAEIFRTGVELRLETTVQDIAKTPAGFGILLDGKGSEQSVTCQNLVVACGGKSIPKMGATGFGYQVARQFGHHVTDTRAGLVPLTFTDEVKADFKNMAGVSVQARVACGKTSFDEALLFTHRGLSGPAILQISSYWREKQPVKVGVLVQTDLFQALREKRSQKGRQSISNALAEFIPKKLASYFTGRAGVCGNLADLSDKALRNLVDEVGGMELYPAGTEGYRTAEVTLGGVSTDGISSQTMESKSVPGLYFIGEVVDVTGWLGGYNFQWAWSSGWCAGTAIATKA